MNLDLITKILGLDKAKKTTGSLLSGFGHTAGQIGNIATGVSPFTTKEQKKQAGRNLIEHQKAIDEAKKNLKTKDLIQAALQYGSYAVPFGKGANLITKTFLPGAATGAMQGAAEDDAGIGSTIKGGLGGATGAGIFTGAGKLAKGGYNLVAKTLNNVGDDVSKVAAQNLTKATPSQYQKAIEEAGIDINEVVKKYVPAGVGFDDLVGTVKEKGKGGLINKLLNERENVIQGTAKKAGNTIKLSGDDLVKALKSEARQIKQELGGEARAKAIDALIKQTEKKYKGGVSVKRALDTLRTANKKFGKNVVDTNPGDAVATAAQKLEGNTMRRVLKEMFPDMAQALDEQKELLTIQPLFNRARSIENTSGSLIRKDGLTSLELNKPLSWIGSVMEEIVSSPERASKALNANTKMLPTMGDSQLLTDIIGQIGSRTGANYSNQNQPKSNRTNEQYTVSDNESSSQLNQNNLSTPNMRQNIPQPQEMSNQEINPNEEITLLDGTKATYGQLQQQGTFQPASTEIQPRQTEITDEQFQQLFIADLMRTGGKNLDKLATLQKLMASDETVDSEKVTGETSLRKEFTDRTKEFNTVQQSYQKIANATPNAQGDMSLIFAYMKMLDPSSTVREGEYANAESTRGVPDEIRAAYNKALNGQKLSETQRTGFKNEAANVYNTYVESQLQTNQQYEDLAGQYGYNPTRIVGDNYRNLQKAPIVPVPPEQNILLRMLGIQ